MDGGREAGREGWRKGWMKLWMGDVMDGVRKCRGVKW
jgi:hypothetical protein